MSSTTPQPIKEIRKKTENITVDLYHAGTKVGTATFPYEFSYEFEICPECPEPSPAPTPTPTPEPTATIDKFGIQMMNPTTTVSGRKREWFIDMANPEGDGQFDRRGGSVIKRPDGSWYTDGSVRLYVHSPAPLPFWKNVEITGYFFIESGTAGVLQEYARGGIHTNNEYTLSNGTKKWGMCMGSKYAGRIYIDRGISLFAKEIGHSVYGPNRGSKSGQFPSLVAPRRWFGFKTLITETKNAQGVEHARMRTYLDDNAQDAQGNLVIKNNWKLMADYTDTGDWSCDDSSTASTVSTMKGLIDKCGTPFNLTREQYARMIITWFGHPTFINDSRNRHFANTASWRWDNMGVKFKFLSVREVVP